MWTTAHCRHCKQEHQILNSVYKKLTDEKIYNFVISYLENFTDKDHIFAELIAKELQIFHKLNLEGILSQKINHYPHESRRNPKDYWTYDSSWNASFYRKLK